MFLIMQEFFAKFSKKFKKLKFKIIAERVKTEMIFESHAHYDDDAFDTDRDTLLSELQENGIGYVMNISSSLSSVQATLSLAEKYSFIYAAVGVHPDNTGELNDESFAWLKEQCKKEKVLAVGEIGLDYYWDSVERDVQDQASRLHARRQMLKVLYPVKDVPEKAAGRKRNTKDVDMVAKLFDEIAPKYVNRNGGYTRIVKIGQRKGDAAMEVLLELV